MGKVRDRWLGLAAAAALLAVPASAQEAAPASAPPAPTCSEERTALEAERAQLRSTIAAIATGRGAKKQRRKVSGGDVAKGVAGTAATVLLPFPFGLAVNAGASAAGKKGGKSAPPADPGPDVYALIARQQAAEARLAELAGTCPAPAAPAER
jgi:hypothetical protein